jgi:hypothetical protein
MSSCVPKFRKSSGSASPTVQFPAMMFCTI